MPPYTTGMSNFILFLTEKNIYFSLLALSFHANCVQHILESISARALICFRLFEVEEYKSSTSLTIKQKKKQNKNGYALFIALHYVGASVYVAV